jgi:hypothetical protein
MKKLFIFMSIIFLFVLSGCVSPDVIPKNSDYNETISEDYLLSVARGEVEGAYMVHKFGANDNVGTTLVPITSTGFYRTPTSAVSLEILSSDADDNSAGVGGRSVAIIGLNASGHEITQIVNLNGLSAVQIPIDMLRVYRAYIYSSGSYATQTSPSHQGTITIRESGGGQNWAQITTIGGFGSGQTEIGVYTVPKGYTCSLLGKTMSVNSVKYADMFFFQRQNILQFTAPYNPIRLVERHAGVTGIQEIKSTGAISVIPELTDIGFMGKSPQGTSEVSVEFELLCESN